MNGQSARISTIAKMLNRAGFSVEIFPVGKIIRKSTLERIQFQKPQIVVGSSFIQAPNLVKIVSKFETFVWFDFMDSAIETRRWVNAGLFRWIYFQIIEKSAINKIIKNSNIITYISQKDLELDRKFEQFADTKSKIFIFPNGYVTNPRKYVSSSIKRLVIVGDFSYRHNKKMLKNAKKISVKLRLPLHIYGHGKNPKINIKQKSFIHGYTKSDKQMYQKGDLHLAPVEQIAGINNKVVNALLKGNPVLTTIEGVQGIKKTDGVILFSISKLDQLDHLQIKESLIKIQNRIIWKGFEFNEEKQLNSFLRNHFLLKSTQNNDY
jgi:hypothetical protein